MSEDGSKPSLDDKRRCSISSQAEAFRSLIEKATQAGKKQAKFAIFSHRCPDPDAIGSMMGLSWLLQKQFGVETDCFYDGEISHPQNIALVNLLDPQLRPVAEYDAKNYALRILVDTVPNNAGAGGQDIPFDVVIDHHKEVPNGGFQGLVIHVKTGSCCAIIYKLICLIGRDVLFEDDNDSDSKVATAIITGIVTDTEYMMSDDSTEYEFEAFSKLFPHRDPDFLKEIVFFKRPRLWIEYKAKAASSAEVDDDGYAIVGLGMIQEKQRDLIADMAEEMVNWASVETAIAFAVVGGERLEASVRSQNSSLSVPDLCKKLGGKHGQGGGKLGKGAYRYSLAGLSIDPAEDDDTQLKTWLLILDKEAKRIRRLINK
jgi:nanoRNase/pAp phosphatase (c-di-AMP/oligoRNAs hydrolase)